MSRALRPEATSDAAADRRSVIGAGMWQVEPTWDNAEAFLHRLWGQARHREYRKPEWAAFHALFQRLRAASAPATDVEEITHHLLSQNGSGVFAWLRRRLGP